MSISDHAATSPLSAKSQSAMRAAEEQAFGNPNSGHWAGAVAERVLEAARRHSAAGQALSAGWF